MSFDFHNPDVARQSRMIEGLRLPLMIGIVFAHAYGAPAAADATGLMAFYEVCRSAISHVISHCGVTVFFLISGYLFFLRVEQWNLAVYFGKMRRRVRSLILPYFLWSVLYILCLAMRSPDASAYLATVNWHWFWDVITIHHHATFWSATQTAYVPMLYPFWFVRDLIGVSFLTLLLYPILQRCGRWFLAGIFVILFASCAPNLPGFSIMAIAYFSLGAYIALRKQLLTTVAWQVRYLAGICALVLGIPVIALDGVDTPIVASIQPVLLCALTFCVLNLGGWLERRGKMALSLRFSSTAFFLYGLHAMLIEPVAQALSRALPGEAPLLLLCRYLLLPFIIAAVSIALYALLQRFACPVLRLFTGGRASR